MTTIAQLIEYLERYDRSTPVEYLGATGPADIVDAVLHESIDGEYSVLYLTTDIEAGSLFADEPEPDRIDWDIQPPSLKKDTEEQTAKVKRYTKSDLFAVVTHAVEHAGPNDSINVVVDELHKFLTTGRLPG